MIGSYLYPGEGVGLFVWAGPMVSPRVIVQYQRCSNMFCCNRCANALSNQGARLRVLLQSPSPQLCVGVGVCVWVGGVCVWVEIAVKLILI